MQSDILNNHLQCLENRTMLRNLLMDYFKGNNLMVNIILDAYDMGIVDIINQTDCIDNLLLGKCIKKLQNDFGVSAENANSSIQFWISEYAIACLKKKVELNTQYEIKKTNTNNYVNIIQNDDRKKYNKIIYDDIDEAKIELMKSGIVSYLDRNNFSDLSDGENHCK